MTKKMGKTVKESAPARPSEGGSGRWSWKVWLFYLICIAAIVVAITFSGKVFASGWWSGSLGRGDAFYNYNAPDSRWVDVVNRQMNIPPGSAWLLEVRSRSFMPQADLRIKNVYPSVSFNLGRVSYHTTPGGLHISTRCFARNPHSPGPVTATVQPWITSKELRLPSGQTPGGQYFFRIIKIKMKDCPPPVGAPRNPVPISPPTAPPTPVAPSPTRAACPTWGRSAKRGTSTTRLSVVCACSLMAGRFTIPSVTGSA